MPEKRHTNPVPTALIDFRVYLGGVDLVGVADVELPDLEATTAEVTGAGIAGTADMPITGHYGSLSLKLNWRTLGRNLATLAAPKAHHLEMRGSAQVYDAGEGTYDTLGMIITTKAIPKNTGLGKMASGEAMESPGEFEVVYLKVVVEGKEVIEIDKFNYKCVINGVDYLANVRGDLGL